MRSLWAEHPELVIAGVALALLCAVAALALRARRAARAATGLPAGRGRRLARIARLWTALSASFLGARLRRLFASSERRERLDAARRAADAERVAREMGQMKGAFMKLGQMISFVTDDVPAEYRRALASLQAHAPAMSFAVLRDVAERELGAPLERAYASFETRPLAAASIGQVHRARLPSGEPVVVKIQYPGVGDAIRADLDNVALLYQLTRMFFPAADPREVIDELRERLLEELDYVREAEHQRAFHALFAGHPFIQVPRVIESHSTPHVITMELVEGRRFEEVLESAGAEERSRLGEILYRFVLGNILRHRLFNGDPHPGNYLFDGGRRVAFLDFGCVKRFPEPMFLTWRELVRAHLAGDRARFRALAVELGFFRADDRTLDADRVYDYFAYFYEPFHDDREFAFTREYNQRSFRQIFSPDGKFAGMQRHLNMPRDFVFVNRIHWGVYSILARLGARANFHRIHREYLDDAEPSTELGRLEAEFRAARAR